MICCWSVTNTLWTFYKLKCLLPEHTWSVDITAFANSQIKSLPEPLVQLCNIRLSSPARQGSSLAHFVKEQQQRCIHRWLNIHSKSLLMQCFLNCTNHYLITFDKLHRANLLREEGTQKGRLWVGSVEGECNYLKSRLLLLSHSHWWQKNTE